MKKRSKTLPRQERTIREWEDKDWCFELCQKPSGDYIIYAASETDWRIESGATIKACLRAVKQSSADLLAMVGE